MTFLSRKDFLKCAAAEKTRLRDAHTLKQEAAPEDVTNKKKKPSATSQPRNPLNHMVKLLDSHGFADDLGDVSGLIDLLETSLRRDDIDFLPGITYSDMSKSMCLESLEELLRVDEVRTSLFPDDNPRFDALVALIDTRRKMHWNVATKASRCKTKAKNMAAKVVNPSPSLSSRSSRSSSSSRSTASARSTTSSRSSSHSSHSFHDVGCDDLAQTVAVTEVEKVREGPRRGGHTKLKASRVALAALTVSHSQLSAAYDALLAAHVRNTSLVATYKDIIVKLVTLVD